MVHTPYKVTNSAPVSVSLFSPSPLSIHTILPLSIATGIVYPYGIQTHFQPRSIYLLLTAPLPPLHEVYKPGIRFISQSIIEPRSIYQTSLPTLHYLNELGILFESQSSIQTLILGMSLQKLLRIYRAIA